MTSAGRPVAYAGWVLIVALGWIVISGGDAEPEVWLGTVVLMVWLIAHMIVRGAEDG